WKQNYILVDEYFFFCCTWIVNSACLKKCTSIVIDFLVVFLDEKLMQNSVFIMKMMPKRTTRL
ncbi:hypothetical protein LJD49_24610, partial [Escherichia coli]|nr:hypothetical protein [Escherichia coli]